MPMLRADEVMDPFATRGRRWLRITGSYRIRTVSRNLIRTQHSSDIGCRYPMTPRSSSHRGESRACTCCYKKRSASDIATHASNYWEYHRQGITISR
ncbi:hypothetical protein PIIN_05860 [Serendipita indica DSM 11827]|uniref:Uncharacterized protein n=1 Tax=Serendipita indica (strain DSM 11827) TaxID=1109443 RepID=G4TKT2_SERID|nr:hypothetical protein PIIN_05860 [Serendipita indica DSM 11827]